MISDANKIRRASEVNHFPLGRASNLKSYQTTSSKGRNHLNLLGNEWTPHCPATIYLCLCYTLGHHRPKIVGFQREGMVNLIRSSRGCQQIFLFFFSKFSQDFPVNLLASGRPLWYQL
jgi:hypothetical protein